MNNSITKANPITLSAPMTFNQRNSNPITLNSFSAKSRRINISDNKNRLPAHTLQEKCHQEDAEYNAIEQ